MVQENHAATMAIVNSYSYVYSYVYIYIYIYIYIYSYMYSYLYTCTSVNMQPLPSFHGSLQLHGRPSIERAQAVALLLVIAGVAIHDGLHSPLPLLR